MEKVTQDAVLRSLRDVKDPDLHEDIVTLGFVKNIRICDGNVAFDIELTTPACPVKEKLHEEATAAVKKLPGVRQVNASMSSRVRSSLPPAVSETLKGVKNVVAVSSGKGGVGKSTVSVNLALALARAGANVGLMDADVYGPSVPTMLAGTERPAGAGGKFLPIERYGVRFMSLGLLTDPGTPVIWRGPMATKLIRQFLGQVEWGELDYLLIDLPPGTGDVQLTLTQSAPLTGAVVVTTPQDVAVGVTMRGIRMFDDVQVPIIGVIENMSGFVCPHCNEQTDIFRAGGGEKTAREHGFKFLGRVPIDPQLTLASDAGRPVVDLDDERRPASAKAFDKIARDLAAQVSIIAQQTQAVKVAVREITTGDEHVVLKWADATESRVPFRELRLDCPCAECVDERTGAQRLDGATVPGDVHPTGFRMVGRYGVQISWSDGHSTGIYTLARLRQAGSENGNGTSASPAGDSNAETIKDKIVEVLKTIYDPEIPINIYDLGLIYAIDVEPAGDVEIKMTLTAPNCPAAEMLPPEVESKAKAVPGVNEVKLELVWTPPWGKEMLSEAARLQLGL